VLLLAACQTGGVRLSERDHVLLETQPVIHVVHYETPAPGLKYYNKAPPVQASAIRHAAGSEPAAPLATAFARLLEKKENLRNLKIASQSLPRPVATSPDLLPAPFHNGLVLELWIERWSFEAIAGVPGQYTFSLDGRSRLARPADNRTLWSTGLCRVGGLQSRGYRIAAAELANTAKLRKLLNTARNECTRALLRDFNARLDRRD